MAEALGQAGEIFLARLCTADQMAMDKRGSDAAGGRIETEAGAAEERVGRQGRQTRNGSANACCRQMPLMSATSPPLGMNWRMRATSKAT